MLRCDDGVAKSAHTRTGFDVSNGHWCCRSTLSNISLEQHIPKRFTIECQWDLNKKLVVDKKWVPIQNQFSFIPLLKAMRTKNISQNTIYVMECERRIWLHYSDEWLHLFDDSSKNQLKDVDSEVEIDFKWVHVKLE